MPRHALLFLNKVINENDTKALVRHSINLRDMPTEIDKRTYKFIEQYAKQNGGQAPSYALVADSVQGFEYVPEVSDSFDYLAKQVKGFSAKKQILDVLNSGEFERKLNELDGHEFVESWLPSVVDSVKMRTSVRNSIGTDLKTGADKFLDEYNRRKIGESFRIWKSKFSSIGYYISSNVYTVYGKSGRGKSVITLEDALYAAQQGANVLVWAMEMPTYEVMVRAYVSLSGDLEVAKKVVEGVEMGVGFDSDGLRAGQLDEQFEQAFKEFLRNINDYLDGNLIVRGVDDDDFTDRSLRALEADIEATNADFVVIDPFYYMQYEKNTSKTAGGDAAETSKHLRALAGRTQTVIVAITQAEEGDEKDKEGKRELKLPERKDVKKTKQLLEDAYQLIAVDTDYKDGRGLVGVNKGRDGGEGNVSEIQYLPQYGIVKELTFNENDGEEFDF